MSHSVVDVVAGQPVLEVAGIVEDWWRTRVPIVDDEDEELGRFEDDGPLAKQSEKVFNITMVCGKVPSSCDSKMKVFFYDEWATQCNFLTSGDRIVISGPPSIVHHDAARAEDDPEEHPYCLALKDYTKHGPRLGIEVRPDGIQELPINLSSHW
jgi:hypothetical protein